jgi:hypothetical protein
MQICDYEEPFMKTQLLIAYLTVFGAFCGFSQTPPPNDNYSNSIPYTGADTTFTTSLAGTTHENHQEIIGYQAYYNNPANVGNIWWSWTPPTNTCLIVEYFDSPLASNFMVCIYNTSNGCPVQNLPIVTQEMPYLQTASPQTVSIPTVAGSNYLIQLAGCTNSLINLRFLATNVPVIITQPLSHTVYSNATALFYVTYAGLGQPNFTFQWSFNGTNLPAQTAPMLALTNIDSNMAGEYTVAVSNQYGVTISQPAMLTVSQSDVPVTLAPLGAGSNIFGFSVSGEPGRYYRLQSSSNLATWNSAAVFPETYYGDATSVFYLSNSPQVLLVTNSASSQFYRLTPYVVSDTVAQICINNLAETRVAKLLWGSDWTYNNNFYSSAGSHVPPSEYAAAMYTDLQPYFPNGIGPVCPSAYPPYNEFIYCYDINYLGSEPSCDIYPTNHLLEQPQ